MNRRRLILLVLAIVVLVAGAAFIFWQRHSTTSTDSVISSSAPDTTASGTAESFSGVVAKTSNGCSYDDTCSVTLTDGKVIITGCGLMADGKTCASYDQSQLKPGDTIQVTAVKVSDTYSLGCDTCGITK